mgnify:CR=1 FL=1
MRITHCAYYLGCALFLSSAATFADSHKMEAKIEAIKVSDNIHMLTGKGGNIGVLTGADGTFMIDDQFSPLTPKILAKIKEIGGEHPKFLINTHFHGDHTGGNENLGKAGTLIVSHNNVRERMASGSYIQAFKMKSLPASADALPVITFSDDISFHINGGQVHAIHTPHAHTDGDSFIHFKEQNVIHAGDLFFNGFYPFIDINHGGSVKGMISAVDKILAIADDKTKIIPGHGPLATKSDLQAYRDMLQTAYNKLRLMKISGMSVTDAMAAKPLAELDQEWSDGLFSSSRWIEIVYPGIY